MGQFSSAALSENEFEASIKNATKHADERFQQSFFNDERRFALVSMNSFTLLFCLFPL